MAMPAQQTEWTLELVRALLDDGSRYEVIDGELFVTAAPSWTHQRAEEPPRLLRSRARETDMSTPLDLDSRTGSRDTGSA